MMRFTINTTKTIRADYEKRETRHGIQETVRISTLLPDVPSSISMSAEEADRLARDIQRLLHTANTQGSE